MSPDSEKRKRPVRKAKPTTGETEPKKSAHRKAKNAEPQITDKPPLPVAHMSDAPTSDAEALEAEIRRRAYELYVARGRVGGDDLTDWLEAERSLRGGT